MDLAAIEQCRQITEAHIAEAIETREDTRALLEHAASISAPRQGGARILLVFAKIARDGSDWLDGALRVELRRVPEGSAVDVYAEIGAGLRERVLPSFTMRLPLEEFLAAIKRVPEAIAPLSLVEPGAGGRDLLVLRAGEVPKSDGIPERAAPLARVPTPKPFTPRGLPTIVGARRPIPKRPGADAGRTSGATPPDRPPPARIPTPMGSPVDLSTKPNPAATTVGAPPVPEVEALAPPVPAAVPEAPSPQLSLRRSGEAAADASADDADLPAPATPFARIKLRRAVGLPRIVTEVDAPAAVRHPHAEPAPASPEPGPPRPSEPQPAQPRSTDEAVDEGWD